MTPDQTFCRELHKTRFYKWWESNSHPSISQGMALSTWIAASYEALGIPDPAVYASTTVEDSGEDLLG